MEKQLLASVLSDDKALFIAEQIYKREDKSIKIEELDKYLEGAAGWIPLAKLAAAQIVDITSQYVYLTAIGEQLLEDIGIGDL